MSQNRHRPTDRQVRSAAASFVAGRVLLMEKEPQQAAIYVGAPRAILDRGEMLDTETEVRLVQAIADYAVTLLYDLWEDDGASALADALKRAAAADEPEPGEAERELEAYMASRAE